MKNNYVSENTTKKKTSIFGYVAEIAMLAYIVARSSDLTPLVYFFVPSHDGYGLPKKSQVRELLQRIMESTDRVREKGKITRRAPKFSFQTRRIVHTEWRKSS
jgi:hypothetical protein